MLIRIAFESLEQRQLPRNRSCAAGRIRLIRLCTKHGINKKICAVKAELKHLADTFSSGGSDAQRIKSKRGFVTRGNCKASMPDFFVELCVVRIILYGPNT